MKIKRSYLQLHNFDQIAGAYIDKIKPNDNILSSAIKKIAKQLKDIFEDYFDEKDNLQITHCLKDEKKQYAIMLDEHNQRMFSEEGMKKLKAALKELNKKEYEVHTRIPEGIEALIPSLTEIEKEYFSGLVIPEQNIEG